MSVNLPARFETVEAVEDFMTSPSAELVADLAATPGDILVLGVGGKMGPTRRAASPSAPAPGKRVIGVARFSEPGLEARRWRSAGHRADRLRISSIEAAIAKVCRRRPTSSSWQAGNSAPTGDLPLTWAMNVFTCRQWSREVFRELPHRRVLDRLRLSVRAGRQRWRDAEDMPPIRPANMHNPASAASACSSISRRCTARPAGCSASITRSTCAMACCTTSPARCCTASRSTCRHGARQRDLAGRRQLAQALRCLARATTPTTPINVTGLETIEIRCRCARRVRQAAGPRRRRSRARKAPTGWLNERAGGWRRNSDHPSVPTLERMIEWTADWLERDMPSLEQAHANTRCAMASY